MKEQKQTQSITISKRTLIIIIAIILALIAGAITLAVNWNLVWRQARHNRYT